MKKSSHALGLMLWCALVLGVTGCGDKVAGGTGEKGTTAPTASVTTTSNLEPDATIAVTTTTVALESAAEAEEYAVYSALIQAMYIDAGAAIGGGRPASIVIQDHTELGPVQTMSEILNGMSNAWPDLPDEILADFEAKNEQPQALKPLFSLSIDYALFSDQEMESIFVDSSGWDAFYEMYPHSQGILTLSRVGLKRGLEMAVVCAGNQMHWVAGEGYFVLLRKVNGQWTVQAKQMTWMS